MKYQLKNVRLSFPSLFHKAKFEGAETKYEATFLLDKEEHADIIKQLQGGIAAKIKDDLKGAKLGPDKICLKDGDNIDYDGYEGKMSIKASNGEWKLLDRWRHLVATIAQSDSAKEALNQLVTMVMDVPSYTNASEYAGIVMKSSSSCSSDRGRCRVSSSSSAR